METQMKWADLLFLGLSIFKSLAAYTRATGDDKLAAEFEAAIKRWKPYANRDVFKNQIDVNFAGPKRW